jgi:hypothetical protein
VGWVGLSGGGGEGLWGSGGRGGEGVDAASAVRGYGGAALAESCAGGEGARSGGLQARRMLWGCANARGRHGCRILEVQTLMGCGVLWGKSGGEMRKRVERREAGRAWIAHGHGSEYGGAPDGRKVHAVSTVNRTRSGAAHMEDDHKFTATKGHHVDCFTDFTYKQAFMGFLTYLLPIYCSIDQLLATEK